jgi:23S rRNA pseudouridine2605 synthase
VGERLQKVMARAGLGSRRACEAMISQGRVRVNGEVAVLGQKVDLKQDHITVDGRPLGSSEKKRYLVVNKPVGYITSVKDQFGRPTVMDLVPHIEERVYPVGRLDYDSQGLILLTNDGWLANRVLHPRFELPKTYLVKLKGRISNESVNRLRNGVDLDDGPTNPAQVRLLKVDANTSLFEMVISEGRNRQVRRMCQAVGHQVEQLTRTAVGPIRLADLPLGASRDLTGAELKRLREAVGND